MRPVVVWAPEYRHTSAGIRAMHRLVGELLERGVGACLSADATFGDGIHVVPETQPMGLPEGARIVRWLLGPSRPVPTQAGSFDVTWHRELHPDCEELRVDLLERDYFFSARSRRTETLVYVGKGLGTSVGTKITGDWPKHRSELGGLLRKGKVLYCHDAFSLVPIEAVVCGCPVVIVGPSLDLWDDVPGVARGPGDLERARHDVAEAAEWYEGERIRYAASVDYFAHLLESAGGPE